MEKHPPTFFGEHFAQVVWTIEDVLTLCPTMTREQAKSFLINNQNTIRDMTIQHGWEVIEQLLLDEGNPIKKF